MRHLIHKRLNRSFLASALLAAFVAGLVSLSPVALTLEETLGLDWLTNIRGPISSPDNIVVIAMNRPSAQQLGVSGEPGQWPRQLHTQLLNKLTAAGAKTIAFDILFHRPQDAQHDSALGQAISQHGNVVLFEKIEKGTIDSRGSALPSDDVVIEKLIPPIPDIAQHAAALAPFPLPRVPLKVSQFWKFVPGAGDAPTLPATALLLHLSEHYALYREIISSVDMDTTESMPLTQGQLANHGIVPFMKSHRQHFITKPNLAQELSQTLAASTHLSDNQHRAIKALISLFSGNASEYLNLYGPPHSIITIPYHEVLAGEPGLSLHDKAIFIGASAMYQWEQYDGFYTTFSQSDGLDISGVEIAATAFANLLNQQSLQPLSTALQFIIISVWGLILCILCAGRSAVIATLLSACAASALLLTALYLFTAYNLWLPIVLPLLIQWPLTLIAFIIWRNSKINREQNKLIQTFGHYLPKKEVQRLAKSTAGPASDSQLVFGICLFTDAQQYTRLSEQLKPSQLAALINRYYAVLFEPVKQYGGIVSDIKGDSMLAIWSATHNTIKQRQQACQCALALVAALNHFNKINTEHPLPTRIGVHCGDIMLGNVGAGHHFEYRAVGDIVNTASRIEGLNKYLGSQLLVSSEMLEGLSNFATRELGTFQLAGKTQPTTLHELICLEHELDSQNKALNVAFNAALHAFQQRQWRQALSSFTAIASRYHDNQAAQFYIALCQKFLNSPPDHNWSGIVPMDKK